MVEFKVLIVDNDYINRKLLNSILHKELYQVKTFEATNGEEALEICYQESKIDVILLDIEMPLVNGIEFLERYLKEPLLSHVPIIAISSNDLSKKEAFNAGAHDFLVKPITEERLLSSILASSTL
ncbi:MAG TPA: response regulator [Campylobacterales bacterium]|nr:response regulator [Campylobacterales bacterium]